MIRSIIVALALVSSFATLPSAAVAKEGVGGTAPSFAENAPKNYESSQWFAFEIKFGLDANGMQRVVGLFQ